MTAAEAAGPNKQTYMTQSLGVSLCDIIRNVVKKAVEDEPAESLAAVLGWLDGDGSAGWIGAHVVDTAAFRTALKTPDLSVGGLLEQCNTAAAAYSAAETEGGPDRAHTQSVVQLLASRWAGADLEADDGDGGGDDEDSSSSYKYAKTVQALQKSKEQLPMLVAVQQALAMFPEGLAGKLDAQAASVGDSVRKQAMANKKMKPGDIIGTVMQNPAFLDMMKTMMEQDPGGGDADAAAHEQQRALSARLQLIEMRLSKLEAGGGTGMPSSSAVRRKKKGRGGRPHSNTPTY